MTILIGSELDLQLVSQISKVIQDTRKSYISVSDSTSSLTAQIEQVQDKELYTPSVLIHRGHDSMIDRSTDVINAYHC